MHYLPQLNNAKMTFSPSGNGTISPRVNPRSLHTKHKQPMAMDSIASGLSTFLYRIKNFLVGRTLKHTFGSDITKEAP
jgi:hypothetical protein